ncbi:MAG: hypothetical protein HG456_003060 [candidate division SR1 bacterium]|jgi:hypothetical protein|nr:hypothetical protein [candidate division SR1 bacterium]
MSEKNQEKDLNNKESKIKRWREKHKKSIRNTFLTLLAAGAVYHTADKWTSAQDRLESGATEARIESVVEEQKVLIEAYNTYFDEYEAMGKTLVELQSEGDLAGYRNTFDQREALREEIKNVEERIDKLGRKRQELEIDLTEGKVQAARDITPIPHAKGKERRTFKEYQ